MSAVRAIQRDAEEPETDDAGRPRFDEGDRQLVVVTLLLAGFGLVFILSASQALAYVEHRWPLYYAARQAAFVGVGLIAMAITARLDLGRLRRWAWWGAAGAFGLMVLVLVPHLGVQVNGARRWFSLGPLGTFQPSELGKLAFAFFLADWVDRHHDELPDLEKGALRYGLMLFAALGALMLEKDLGTAVVTGAIFLSILWAGGAPKLHIAGLIGILVAVAVIATVSTPYRAARLATFGDPFKDPLNTGFQSSQGLIALGAGGWQGVGLGHSVQKFLWLPAAHTDFIFAIIGEETGLIGTTLVLGAFVFFGWRGYRAALRAPDRFSSTLAAGITTWIVVQALVNMGTVTDTLPATGVPLPFISYGGTSVIFLLAAVGVLLNIAARGVEGGGWGATRRVDASFDIGRGHRRSPAARARRRAGLPR